MLTLADVSTAAAGFELTIRRLQDGRYTSTATAETMRIEGRRGGQYCLGTSLGSDGLHRQQEIHNHLKSLFGHEEEV